METIGRTPEAWNPKMCVFPLSFLLSLKSRQLLMQLLWGFTLHDYLREKGMKSWGKGWIILSLFFFNDNCMRYRFTLIRLGNSAKSLGTKFWPKFMDSYKDDKSAKLVQPLWTATWWHLVNVNWTSMYLWPCTSSSTWVPAEAQRCPYKDTSWTLFNHPAVMERIKHTEVYYTVESYIVSK